MGHPFTSEVLTGSLLGTGSPRAGSSATMGAVTRGPAWPAAWEMALGCWQVGVKLRKAFPGGGQEALRPGRCPRSNEGDGAREGLEPSEGKGCVGESTCSPWGKGDGVWAKAARRGGAVLEPTALTITALVPPAAGHMGSLGRPSQRGGSLLHWGRGHRVMTKPWLRMPQVQPENPEDSKWHLPQMHVRSRQQLWDTECR